MRASTPIDRRPIAARQWRFFQAVSRRLAGLGVSPNAISVAGMVSGLLAGAALAATTISGAWGPACWLLAAVLILLRLLANMLDGMVALEAGSASPLGFLFNEIPDRVSDSAILIGLGYAGGGMPALGFGAAMAAMFTAYVRSIGVQAGGRQEFCGPMAKQQRMAIVIVVALASAVCARGWLPDAALGLIAAGSVLTAGRRLLRLARQLRGCTR